MHAAPNAADYEREIAQSLEFYTRHYDSGQSWLLTSDKPETKLGSQEGLRQCRFCGRTEPTVTFKKEAHAVSELTGNKTLFVRYECDECNLEFGSTLENHLGNWSKPLRTLFQVSGKRGIPTVKSRDKTARFSVDNGVLNVDHKENDPSVLIDDVQKTFTITLPRDSYSPLLVLKALTKNALNLIPETRIALFEETIKWVKDVSGQSALFEGQSIGVQYSPGRKGGQAMLASLFFRTNDFQPSPYCLFLLSFGNVTIQLYVFSRPKDWYLLGKNGRLPFFPVHSPEHSLIYGEPVRFVDDMSQYASVKDSSLRVEFRYESSQVHDSLADEDLEQSGTAP